MSPLKAEIEKGEIENQKYFDQLPENILDGAKISTVKGSQFLQPLFEFSGACAGCGETPYVKLVTQLFGDRMMIANATGCSSIYGGTFPAIPYCTNKEGHGPAWANSLFEDNAEYGFGYRLAVDSNRAQLKAAMQKITEIGSTPEFNSAIKQSLEIFDQVNEDAKAASKKVRQALPQALAKASGEEKQALEIINELQEYIIDKSIWILGGDGWAYDIGYSGLDHVMATDKNINVLVLDTEVYSNTGGQASKATPRGAVAKFAAAGKKMAKKNLGLMLSTYGNVYVASVNMGASQTQVLKAFIEAEQYNGPSIIIAYSPCIAHGIDMRQAQSVEKQAAQTGYWPLYRFNPALELEGKSPFIWDSKEPKGDFADFANNENRYKILRRSMPDEAERLLELAKKDNERRFKILRNLED
jgi:pyruvate-ferredoxin/flavodoxin oxidoreductase